MEGVAILILARLSARLGGTKVVPGSRVQLPPNSKSETGVGPGSRVQLPPTPKSDARWTYTDFNCQRPYCVESTRSHSNSEVKLRKARSVLGWGTAWEALRVLLTFLCTKVSKKSEQQRDHTGKKYQVTLALKMKTDSERHNLCKHQKAAYSMECKVQLTSTFANWMTFLPCACSA